jgi:DNA-binding Lrp family transcriptional regulator
MRKKDKIRREILYELQDRFRDKTERIADGNVK